MFLVLLTIISLASIAVVAFGNLPFTGGGMDILFIVKPLNLFNRHSSIQYLKGIRDLNSGGARRLF